MFRKPLAVMFPVFAVGFAAGWLTKPVHPAAFPPSGKSAQRPRPPRPAREPSPQTKAGRHWIDRIKTSGAREVAKEVPTGDFKEVIEGLMAKVWGGMTQSQLEQLVVLIAGWAGRDMDGALEWARGLDNPKQREVGLISIAAKVAKTDPKAAFEIFAEVEEVATEARNYLSPTMRTLYNDAAKQGVKAILDLANRTPHNGTNSSEGISIDYPAGFDFRALVDGLLKTTDLGGNQELSKPFSPSDPFGPWALQDADAAFDYVVTCTSQGQYLRWSGMTYELGKKLGTLETERWLGSKLGELTPGEQQALLQKSDLAQSPGYLRKYIATMPPEAAAEFRFQVLDHSKGMLIATVEILNDVPEIEERVATLERLRGVNKNSGLRTALKGWNLPPDRIERIIETVESKAP
jgi:hypothetical protein